MQSTNCLNCEIALPDAAHYCPQCGQKAHLHRLNLHEIGHDALHYFTHADKGFLLLLKQLTLKRGNVAREFVFGKRKKYFPPLNFFLLAATVYVFLVNVYASNKPVISEKDRAYIQRITDSTARHRVARIYERREKAVHTINKYSNFIYMFATPLIAFIIWLFYRKGAFNYTEHLVANLYISGYVALFYVLIILPLRLLLQVNANYALISFFIFEIVYRSVFYYQFMGRKTRAGALQAVSTSLFVIVFWVVSTYWLVRFYIVNGLWGLFS